MANVDGRKAKLFLIFALLVFVAVVGGSVSYLSNDIKGIFNDNLTPSVAEAQATPLPAIKGKNAYVLSNIPSPFGSVDSSTTTDKAVNNPQVPASLPIPTRTPNFSGIDRVVDRVVVKGVFAGSGTNYAIIGSGQEQIIVSEGAQTRWGVVDSVTADGLYISDVFYAYSPESANDSSETKKLPPVPTSKR